ncbi:hypothetical protein LQ757_16885 [Agromyces sp. SYSU K20354]|uniref:hypothetical protein n=1 Tax=Agromyces cavernae TaxID=2898659 RepID=UPI001E5ACC53|nr:hypothetical protein [Agromyces cavernae]MCD2443959.1 hypothetical protein [Agromyces cavernae]
MSEHDRNETALARELKAAADASTPRAIDVDAVLGASRAKRRARRTAVVGGAGALVAVLAVGGLVFGMQDGLFGSTSADSSLESGSVAESAPEVADERDESGPVDAEAALEMPYCGARVAPTTDPATAPLAVRLVVPENTAPGTSVAADVIVTNDGEATVSGSIRLVPGLAVDDDGVVVWRTSDPGGPGTGLELAPGESLTLRGSLETRRCVFGDEPLDEAPRADLPPLTAGSYGARAMVEFFAFDSLARFVLVSPGEPFTVE